MVKPGSAAAHVRKATGFVRATRTLLESELSEQATADAYYAVFHVAQALLATAGLGTETHNGVHTLLARHFVKDGPLPPHVPRMLSHLMGDRLLADYGVEQEVDLAGGRDAAASAVSLITAMLPVLRDRAPEASDAVQHLAQATEALAQVTGRTG